MFVLLGDLSPWVFLTLGLALLLLDLFVTNDSVTSFVGLAVGGCAVPAKLDIGGTGILWTFAILLGLLLIVARPFWMRVSRRPTPGIDKEMDVGTEGWVLSVHEDAPWRGQGALQGAGEWLITHRDRTPMQPEQRFVVVARQGATLVVETQPEPLPTVDPAPSH